MNYRIKYQVYLTTGNLLDKEIIVKNKDNELFAKVSLEEYLRRKHGDSFIKLIINDCREDYFSSAFMDRFGGFKWK